MIMNKLQTWSIALAFVLSACNEDDEGGGDVGAHCHQEDDCKADLVCEMDEDGDHGECVENTE